MTELNRAWLPAVEQAVQVLLGRRAHDGLGGGRVPLLVCGVCGDLGCGAWTVDLRFEDDRVRWSSWRWVDASGHAAGGEASLGEVTFDRRAYERVFAAAAERVARMPYDARDRDDKRFLWPWQWGWKV